MENNNNEVLVKLNMLVTKIDELEKQVATLKAENSAINSRIDREYNRFKNYMYYANVPYTEQNRF
jgi:polysaccharide deacetylase 2 family uncharacterized protein YibQ